MDRPPARFGDPELSAAVDKIVMDQHLAEQTKQRAAEALMIATMEAARIVYDLMTQSDDEQVRLRAAEIIFSRTIPKVAAKHVEEQGEVIDSADVASLRESIVAEIKRRSNGQQ